jgi:hypothetical protein
MPMPLLQVGPFAQVTFARVLINIHTNCENRRSPIFNYTTDLECCADCQKDYRNAYKNSETTALLPCPACLDACALWPQPPACNHADCGVER